MLQDRKILAVVPARGGSKGIPMKNIVPLAGKPLLQYTADVIRQLKLVDRAVVSTDHPEIASVAESCGLSVPFPRPESLSGDVVSDLQVLTHVLNASEDYYMERYDIVLMLQPTCPLRKATHVEETLRLLVEGDYDAVWTVSETDSKAHPLKQLVLNGKRLDLYDKAGGGIVARQQLQPLYHRNGAAYAITRQCLMEQESIMGDRCGAVVIKEPLANIDTWWDLRLAGMLLQSMNDGEGTLS